MPGCNEPRANTTGLGVGWIKAKDLRAGDKVLLLDGRTSTICSVTQKKLHKPITVYNFEVEGFHTYYVGGIGLLVHNKCIPNRDQQAVNELANDYKHMISEEDAWILWGWAQEYNVPGHGPRKDSYWNGYHLKIYGIHVNIR